MRDLKAIAEKYKDPAKLQEALDCIVEDIIDGRIVLGEDRSRAEVELPEREKKIIEYLRDHTITQTAKFFCMPRATVAHYADKWNVGIRRYNR